MNRKVDRIVFFFRSTFSLMFLSRFYLYSNLIERICLERRKVHSGASELEFFLKDFNCFRCKEKNSVFSLNPNQREDLI
jgi:hypothetical protein